MIRKVQKMKKKTALYGVICAVILAVAAVAAVLINALFSGDAALTGLQCAAVWLLALLAAVCAALRIYLLSSGSGEDDRPVWTKYTGFGAWICLALALSAIVAGALAKEKNYIGYATLFGLFSAALSFSVSVPDAKRYAEENRGEKPASNISVISLFLSVIPVLGAAAGALGIIFSTVLMRDKSTKTQNSKLSLVMSVCAVVINAAISAIFTVLVFR